MRQRLAVRPGDTVTFPCGNGHAAVLVGQQEIEICRDHDFVAPGLAAGPADLTEIVGGRGDQIRHRIDDVAMAVIVEVDGITLERRRHELRRAEGAGPGTDQPVRRHIAAIDDIQRGEEFVAEISLAPADAGERGGRAQHRPVAANGAVIGFDAPDSGDDEAVDAIGPLNRIECSAVFFQNGATFGDTGLVDQNIQVVPHRFGEFGLAVEQIHDAQVGRQRRGHAFKSSARYPAPGRLRP